MAALSIDNKVIKPNEVRAIAERFAGQNAARKDPTRVTLERAFTALKTSKDGRNLSFLSGLEQRVLSRVLSAQGYNPVLDVLGWLITVQETLNTTRALPVSLVQRGVQIIATFLIVYDRALAASVLSRGTDKRTILEAESTLLGCTNKLSDWLLPLLRQFRKRFPAHFQGEIGSMASYIDDRCLGIRQALLKF